MRYLKGVGMALLAALVFGVVVVATASAADPMFLFGTDKTAKLSAGEGALKTLGAFLEIKCKAATGSINISNDVDAFSGEIKYTGCTTNIGGEAKSLGALPGEIKQPIEAAGEAHSELCWINEKELKVGAWVETKNAVHIELPLGVLDLMSGGQVGTVTPVNTKGTKFTIAFKAPGGDPEPVSCVGLTGTKTAHVTITENEAGNPKDGGIENTKVEATAELEGQIDG